MKLGSLYLIYKRTLFHKPYCGLFAARICVLFHALVTRSQRLFGWHLLTSLRRFQILDLMHFSSSPPICPTPMWFFPVLMSMPVTTAQNKLWWAFFNKNSATLNHFWNARRKYLPKAFHNCLCTTRGLCEGVTVLSIVCRNLRHTDDKTTTYCQLTNFR